MVKDCKAICQPAPVWEDDYFMGSIYYGITCKRCGRFQSREKGPLELGTYK